MYAVTESNKFSTPGPWHHHVQFANTTRYWSGPDSEESFKNPNNQLRLKELGWIDAEISYQYNHHGFRSENFDDRECGLAFGCSFTEGTGVPIQATWPAQLSKMLGIHIWNFGVGGAALDTVFRLTDHWINFFEPKFIAVLMPPRARFETCLPNNQYKICFGGRLDNHPFTTYSQMFFSNENNMTLNIRRNTLAIQQLCQQKNIPLYLINSMDLIRYDDPDLARDLDHPGPQQLKKVAESFYTKITSS